MILVRLLLLVSVCLAAPLAHAQREKFSLADLKVVEQKWPQAKKLPTGLRYIIEVEGQGMSPEAGDLVSVIYRGAFLDGKMFDENWDRVRPFTLRLGRNFTIPGMDQAIRLLKKGGRGTFILPPDIAYGTRGSPPEIKPNTSLVFEVEIIDIERAADVDRKAATPPAPTPPAK